MYVTNVSTFEPGDYGQKAWMSSDAIDYTSTYRVIKRTPKRVSVMEVYPARELGPYTYAIREDEKGEYFTPSPVIGYVRPLRPERKEN